MLTRGLIINIFTSRINGKINKMFLYTDKGNKKTNLNIRISLGMAEMKGKWIHFISPKDKC